MEQPSPRDWTKHVPSPAMGDWGAPRWHRIDPAGLILTPYICIISKQCKTQAHVSLDNCFACQLQDHAWYGVDWNGPLLPVPGDSVVEVVPPEIALDHTIFDDLYTQWDWSFNRVWGSWCSIVCFFYGIKNVKNYVVTMVVLDPLYQWKYKRWLCIHITDHAKHIIIVIIFF